MKRTLCDICEGLTKATHYLTFKKGIEKFKVDVCGEHRDWGKGKTYDSALSALREINELRFIKGDL